MAQEELKAYLQEELLNKGQRLSRIEDHLAQTQLFSIQQKRIHGRSYYYKKYRRGSKVISEYLGPVNRDISKELAEAERLRQLKSERRRLQKELIVLEKQLVLANRI